MRVAVLVLALAACKIDLDHRGAEPDAGVSPSCMAIAGKSDFASLQTYIFTPGCAAFSSCHMGGTSPQGKIDLRDGHAYTTLTTMMSTSDSGTAGRMFVVPSDLGSSFLRVMVGTIPPAMATPPANPIPKSTGVMPQSSSMLCAEKLKAIDDWIAAGAPAQ